MYPYFLAIPLPLSIQTRLASFCFGLPQVHWKDKENFHLTMRYFGPLSQLLQAEIQERLKAVFFTPFPLILNGLGHFHKGSRGVIWVGIGDHSPLLSLKKEIDAQLKGLPLLKEERSFQPHITLGSYERLNPQKLGDYLATYAAYQSEPIAITHYCLMCTQKTPKRVIYQVIENYPASLPATGED